MTRQAKALTNERNKVHGNFEDVAATSEGLMAVMMASVNWHRLSSPRREAIKMITHKLARIGAGNADHPDHWDDIGGYAELGKNDGQRPKEEQRAKIRPTSLKKALTSRKAKGAKKSAVRARVSRSRAKNKTRNRRPAPAGPT